MVIGAGVRTRKRGMPRCPCGSVVKKAAERAFAHKAKVLRELRG